MAAGTQLTLTAAGYLLQGTISTTNAQAVTTGTSIRLACVNGTFLVVYGNTGNLSQCTLTTGANIITSSGTYTFCRGGYPVYLTNEGRLISCTL